ncbi:Disease resistance protein [Artemisia annua]|uniref:Disease resistance protein n=1 Tax=Artemisia annua TaxID=35608 RepID=A0A2U1KB68_ARTAN|nr:Disease resistance protein [Artemisia annua]
MDSLQLLKLNQLKLTGTYQNIFKELRWLCWREFFLEAIPPELDMENLVAIDMSCSKLKVFQPPDVLPLLQILNLTDSHNLVEVQNISRVPKLDTLVLKNCRSLVRVCHTLGDLTSLTSLNLTGCENLCNRIQPQFIFPSSLKQLFLMDCNLKDTHFSSACYSLNNQPHLEYLNLAVNPCELLPSYSHLEIFRTLAKVEDFSNIVLGKPRLQGGSVETTWNWLRAYKILRCYTNNGVDLISTTPKSLWNLPPNEVGIWLRLLANWGIIGMLGDEVNVTIVVTKGWNIHGMWLQALVYTDEEDEMESFESMAMNPCSNALKSDEDNNEPMGRC